MMQQDNHPHARNSRPHDKLCQVGRSINPSKAISRRNPDVIGTTSHQKHDKHILYTSRNIKLHNIGNNTQHVGPKHLKNMTHY